MERPIVYATVCSGIEAMSEAVAPLKWRPLWFSETARAPCSVLSHHYPHVPNIGDMLAIEGKKYEGEIDILAGGTPCQSFSNAGKRGGLADPRGRLSPAFAKLAHDTRAPWLLWENVPGALWADKGQAFAEILRVFTGRELPVPERGWKSAGIVRGASGKYSVAWRILDSQYTRVAGYRGPRRRGCGRWGEGLNKQRRRVWLVGHRGDWRAPAEILVGAEGQPPVSCPLRLQEHTVVSKFTPVEYERLMGFPDNYTRVSYPGGKPVGDYQRMFMLGNSWPVNCARFVCERIDKCIRGELTWEE